MTTVSKSKVREKPTKFRIPGKPIELFWKTHFNYYITKNVIQATTECFLLVMSLVTLISSYQSTCTEQLVWSSNLKGCLLIMGFEHGWSVANQIFKIYYMRKVLRRQTMCKCLVIDCRMFGYIVCNAYVQISFFYLSPLCQASQGMEKVMYWLKVEVIFQYCLLAYYLALWLFVLYLIIEKHS